MEHFEVVVVGAGLVGAAVAYELANAGVQTLVLEANREVAAGASRSNSGILHTGFDSTPGTLETKMILEQGSRWRGIFDALGVPYRVPGALLVATDEAQVKRLPALADNARRNGVETRLLDEVETRELEPGSAAKGGLLVPGEAITDPFEVVSRLLATGPETRLNWSVRRVEQKGQKVVVTGAAGSVSATFVVNCAGLFADEVAGNTFSISARRGEFVVFEKGTAELVNHILLPVPSERTKGVLVFPTLYGHLCAGPSAVDQHDKNDWHPRQKELDVIQEKAAALFPQVRSLTPVDAWAGLRPVGHPYNYRVEWSQHTPALLNVAGIRSTGLSACLGLSRLVLTRLSERGLEPRQTGPVPQAALGALSAPLSTPLSTPWWERLNRLRGVEGTC